MAPDYPPRSGRIFRGSKQGSHARRTSRGGPKRAAASRARTPFLPTWGAKRARGAIVSGPPPDSWRDWANLCDGPLGLIAERLLADDVADYVSFRAACRPWRLCSTDPLQHGVLDRRFHPHQWITLRTEEGDPRHPYRRGFMNVATGCCRYVDLPELRGHDAFGPTTEGLLVLLDRATFVVRLLNPFTRQAADLPPATALMTQTEVAECCGRIDDLVEVSGAGLADDCTFAVYFDGIRTVAVAKPGDAHWTVVDRSGELFLPAMSYAGRFYCATTRAVMVVETGADQPPRLAVAAELTRPFSRIMWDTVHLVDNGGELTLVDRECNGSRRPRKYEVYRVDLDAGKMVPVRGLGGRAVFIGQERALSVSPSVFPSISADTIYLGFDDLLTSYMDDSPVHLMDGTSEPRRFRGRGGGVPVYGPRRVDEYLSWSVTGYRFSIAGNDVTDEPQREQASGPRRTSRQPRPNIRLAGSEWVKTL